MDDEKSEWWDACLAATLPLIWDWTTLSTLVVIDRVAWDMQDMVHAACTMAMKCHQGLGAHAHSWWMDTCSVAVTAICEVSHDDTVEVLQHLHCMVHHTKHT